MGHSCQLFNIRRDLSGPFARSNPSQGVFAMMGCLKDRPRCGCGSASKTTPTTPSHQDNDVETEKLRGRAKKQKRKADGPQTAPPAALMCAGQLLWNGGQKREACAARCVCAHSTTEGGRREGNGGARPLHAASLRVCMYMYSL